MGVDISISPHSLAQCAAAKCKGYRPDTSTPVLPIGGRLKYQVHRAKRLFPIENIPLPIKTFNGLTIDRQSATKSQYAVEITTLKNRYKKLFYFHRWVAQDEYEQLKLTHNRPLNSRTPFYGTWIDIFDFHEQTQICNSCPVSVGHHGDCQPRLFGYSSLPEIRQGATYFFHTPPQFVLPEVKALISDFNLVFPENKYGDNRNLAEESENRFGRIIAHHKQEGYNIMVGEISPTPETYSEIADTILNRLMFRDPRQNEETFWLHGEQLEGVVNWLNRFMQILSMIVEAEILTDEEKSILRSFAGVMLIFTDAHRNALKYNLKIGTSW